METGQTSSNSEHRIISLISMRFVAITSYLLLITSLFSAFVIGYSVHHHLLYNYEWLCDNVFLPSISRVINLPTERIVFQMAIFIYTPLRISTLFMNWLYTGRTLLLRDAKYRTCRAFMPVFGGLSLIFLILLGLIGERESGVLHVVFFCLFAIFTHSYMISHWLIMRKSETSSVKTVHNVRQKIIVFSLMQMALLFSSFTTYQLYCIRYGYEIFVICEYVSVLGMITYNCLEFNEMCGVIMVIHPKV